MSGRLSGRCPARPSHAFRLMFVSCFPSQLWGARSRFAAAHRPLAPLVFVVLLVVRYRSVPTTGGRLPATIQVNQRGQGHAPGTPSWPPQYVFVFCVAIPRPLAHQERRAVAFVVRLRALLFPSLSAYGHQERARQVATNLRRALVFHPTVEAHVAAFSQRCRVPLPCRNRAAIFPLNGFLSR